MKRTGNKESHCLRTINMRKKDSVVTDKHSANKGKGTQKYMKLIFIYLFTWILHCNNIESIISFHFNYRKDLDGENLQTERVSF